MAEIVAMVLGLMGLVIIATAAIALHRKPAPPQPSELEQARERWVTSGDPHDEEHWKQLLENMED
jgi:hypothetical protein